MFEKLEQYQINYDFMLKDIAVKQVLKEKIAEKAEQLKSEKQNDLIVFHAEGRVDILDKQIKVLESHIELITGQHDAIEPYDNYKPDLEHNKKVLAKRATEHKDLFSSAELITNKENKEDHIDHPDEWELVTDGIKPLKQYRPRAVGTVVTHKADGKEAENTSTTVCRVGGAADYSKVKFCYADNGETIRNRFLLYWNFKRKEGDEAGSGEYKPGYLQSAFVDYYGNARRLSISQNVLSEKSDDKDKFYQLNGKIEPEYLDDSKPKNKYYIHSVGGDVKTYEPIAFMLYPLDQGEFSTKGISELSEFTVPESESKFAVQDQKLIYEGGCDKNLPKTVYLHCTLPEWDYRLRAALEEVQQQINEYNLIISPHLKKLSEVSALHSMVDLHCRHAYRSSVQSKSPYSHIYPTQIPQTAVLKNEIKNRKELKTSLLDLHSGIKSIIEGPKNKAPTRDLYVQKSHIDKTAGKLWELLQSKALYAEIQQYIDHAKSSYKSNGVPENTVPAGPYMESESGWQQIFVTIAECYAALSASDVYRDLVWDKDIQFGLKSLTKLEIKGEGSDYIDDQIKDLWKKTVSESSVNGKVNEDIPTYIVEQSSDIYFNNFKASTQSSLFNLILNNYETLAKPYLGHLIPGPGAPGSLQVVLSCFQPQITQYIKSSLKNDKIIHIKVLKNVLCILNIINPNDGATKIEEFTARDIFKSVIVTMDTNASNQRQANTIKKLKSFFEKVDGEQDEIQKVMNVTQSSKTMYYGAAYGKSVYALFNLVISLQSVQALWQQAEEQHWPIEKIGLELVNSTIQVAMGAGASTAALLVIAERAKFNTQPIYSLLNISKLDDLGNILNHFSIHLAIVQTIISSIYIADHISNERYKEAFLNGISVSANIMLTLGFLARQKEIVTISFLSPGWGGVLLVAGTAINLMFLTYEVGNMVKSALASDSQKYIENTWSEFKLPVSMPDVQLVREMGLGAQMMRYEHYPYKIYGLVSNKDYEDDYRVLQTYQQEPYALYTSEFGKDSFLTKDPIDIIEEKHKQEFWDSDGVRLGKLSWRAIIPLYLQNDRFSVEQIEGMVEFDIGLLEAFFFDGIKTVAQVIEYYEAVKAELDSGPHPENSLYFIDWEAKVGDKAEKIPYSIASLLELGQFTPPTDQEFYQSELWQHDAFKKPDVVMEL